MDKKRRWKCYLGVHYWWEYRPGCQVCKACRKQKGPRASK